MVPQTAGLLFQSLLVFFLFVCFKKTTATWTAKYQIGKSYKTTPHKSGKEATAEKIS